MSGRQIRKWHNDTLHMDEFYARFARWEQRLYDVELYPLQHEMGEGERIWAYRGLILATRKHRMPEREREMLPKLKPESRRAVERIYGRFNGYVVFAKRAFREPSYEGLLTYVPVHGGITWAKHHAGGEWSYGFDTNHASDEEHPEYESPEWAVQHTEAFADVLLIAKRYEYRYRRAGSNGAKGRVIQDYLWACQNSQRHMKFRMQDNMGAMLNVLAGRL